MRHQLLVATCVTFAACAGSQARPQNAAEVRDTEYAGNVKAIEEDPVSETDHEPVVVTTADALQTEGTQAPTDETCVPVPVYFDTSSAALDDTARDSLDRVVKCLEGREEVTIAVIGHDDPRHAKELKDELVAKRTAAVLEYLETKGVDQARYSVRPGD